MRRKGENSDYIPEYFSFAYLSSFLVNLLGFRIIYLFIYFLRRGFSFLLQVCCLFICLIIEDNMQMHCLQSNQEDEMDVLLKLSSLNAEQVPLQTFLAGYLCYFLLFFCFHILYIYFHLIQTIPLDHAQEQRFWNIILVDEEFDNYMRCLIIYVLFL